MPRIPYAERAMRFDAELEAAKTRGDADQVLTAMLTDPARDWLEKGAVVAALGEAQGGAGSPAIRGEFANAAGELDTAPPSQRHWLKDLAMAAVWALWRRGGAAATDVFVTAALHANRDLSEFGMQALAADGDDRAWDEVISMLGELLRTKAAAGTHRSVQALYAIEYLARHAGQGSGRATQLITLVRERWRNIGDQASVLARWPGIGPDGPPPETVSLTLPPTFRPHRPWEHPQH